MPNASSGLCAPISALWIGEPSRTVRRAGPYVYRSRVNRSAACGGAHDRAPQAIAGGISCALFPGCTVSVTQTSNGAVISSQLGQDDTVGILVHRIVRFTRIHGKRVPVLQTIGNVPLGHHRHGHLRIRWNLKVNGHRLGRGKYLITLRGFDQHHVLLGGTKPVIFTVH